MARMAHTSSKLRTITGFNLNASTEIKRIDLALLGESILALESWCHGDMTILAHGVMVTGQVCTQRRLN